MAAKQKTLPLTSYPSFQYPIVEIEGTNILQIQSNTKSTKDEWNYKDDEFVLPSVKTLAGYVEGDNHWLLFVSDESLLKQVNIFIFKDGKPITTDIEKATEAYKRSLVAACLVNDIAPWKELSKILHSKKVFVRHPKGIDIKADISKKESDISSACDILSVLIDMAVELSQFNLLSSTSVFPKYAEDERVKGLQEKYGVTTSVGLLGKYSQIFGVLEVISSEEQLTTRQKQEEISPGQFFDTDETEIVCFPYQGEFPNNLSPIFKATEAVQTKGNGKGGYGGNTVTVQGYSAVEGRKHFIEFMKDNEIKELIGDDPTTNILVCLSLAGVHSLPNFLSWKGKDEHLAEWRQSVSEKLENIQPKPEETQNGSQPKQEEEKPPTRSTSSKGK